MKQTLALVFALLGWATLVAQFYLMMETRTLSIVETAIRFFSYFTILTNILVATYFTLKAFKSNRLQAATPITVYITIVGLVYQLLLRHTWSPTGLQMLVDESLHSVIPLLTIGYWYLFENDPSIAYTQIPRWLIYPLAYLGYILLRGHYANFYPYPFVNVTQLGLQKMLVNSVFLVLVFMVISVLFVGIRKLKTKNTTSKPVT